MNQIRLSRLALAFLIIVCAAGSVLAQQYGQTGEFNTWTTGKVSRLSAAAGKLRIVRAARQDGFDRVVFEFATGVPSFIVSYPRPPIYDELTQALLKISGRAVIEVTCSFNYGENTDIYKGYPQGQLNLPVLLEIKEIDFTEGVQSFALGLPERQAFRVQMLTAPARLVVDIKH